MDEMKELLKKLKKELEKDEKKEKRSSEDIKKDLKKKIDTMLETEDIDETTPIIVMIESQTIVKGKGLKVLGSFSCLSKSLKDEFPVDLLTDAFIRGVASKGNNPTDIDKDIIDEVLESIKKII